MLDDFHNIQTIQLPTQSKLSVATHMASCLLDIHQTVPAVSTSGQMHSNVNITLRDGSHTVRGGIVLAHIEELMTQGVKSMSKTFMETLPTGCTELSPENLQKHIKEFRLVYTV